MRGVTVEVVLADQRAADLERRRPRQLVHHLDRDRPLVPGQPAGEVLHELLFGGRAEQRHRGRGHLAEPGVRQRDGRGLVDGRVRGQRLLDHAGRDLEAAPVDRVVRPAADEQELVVVDGGEVGGPQPGAVLSRQLAAARLEQAGLPGREHVAGVRVDDAQFDAVVGAPDAAALARSPLLLVLQRPPGDRAGELGRAVGAEHGNPVTALELFRQLRRQRRGARADGADAFERLGGDLGLQHHPQRGGRQPDVARAVPLDQLRPGADLELLQQGDAAALDHVRDREIQAADVGEGRPQDVRPAAQVRLVRLVEDQPGRAERRGHPVVGQLDPLGPPGGAAGHHQHGDIARVLQRRTRRPRDGLCRQGPVGPGPQRDRADRLRRGQDRVAGPVRVLGHDHVRGQVDDVPLQADVTEVRAQRHHLAPGADGGDQCRERAGPVAQHDADPPGRGIRGEQRRQVGDRIRVERPGERHALEVQRGRARIQRHHLADPARQQRVGHPRAVVDHPSSPPGVWIWRSHDPETGSHKIIRYNHITKSGSR